MIKKLIKLCKSTYLIVGNGRLKTDANIGKFSFIGSNGSSTVDYILLGKNDF